MSQLGPTREADPHVPKAGQQAGKVVCFETYRREREQRQARVLPYLAPAERRSSQSPFSGVQLTRREVEHRQRMLRHLAEPSAAE